MLKLEHRLMLALKEDLGIQLSHEEVVNLASVLVAVREKKIAVIYQRLLKLFGE